jgi:plasmid stability protein
MSKMIQIRNVPDDLHRRLKIRAAQKGLSLSEYLLRMAEREAERPTIEELTERIRRQSRGQLDIDSAAFVRALRDEIG